MDTVARWPPLCRLDDIPPGGAAAIDASLPGDSADPSSVIVLRDGDRVHAYLNVCPHAGRRLDYAPGKFLRKDDTLICAVHGATFSLADGLCVAGPCRGEHLRRVAVRVIGGEVRLLAAPADFSSAG